MFSVLTLGSTIGETYRRRANAYRRINQFEKAHLDLSKAIELSPNLASGYHNEKARVYEAQKLWMKAIDEYELAMKTTKHTPKGHFHQHTHESIAKALENAQKYDQALDKINFIIEESEKTDGSFDRLYLDRARILRLKGNYSEAIKDYSKYINFYKDIEKEQDAKYFLNNPLYGRGLSYKASKQCFKALKDFRRACNLGNKEACGEKC